MSFDIHLHRPGGIPLSEWKAAVSEVEGLRLDSSPSTAVHARTGMKIEIAGNDGDVAMLIAGTWTKVFRYFEGEIRCKSSLDPNDPVGGALLSLAKKLGGQIIDDR